MRVDNERHPLPEATMTTTRKQSKHAGARTVRQLDSRTVLVDDCEGGALYDLQRLQKGRYIVTKIDADGEAVRGSQPYTVDVPARSCTCAGHRHGYACRHVAFLSAILARGTVAVA